MPIMDLGGISQNTARREILLSNLKKRDPKIALRHQELHDALLIWFQNRHETIKMLRWIAGLLNAHHYKVNIAKLSGNTITILGTGLGIAGFALSFETFGASLILSAVGASIAGSGLIASTSASVADSFISKDVSRKANKILKDDRGSTLRVLFLLNDMEAYVIENHFDYLKMLSNHSNKVDTLPDTLFNDTSFGGDVVPCIIGKDIIHSPVDVHAGFQLAGRSTAGAAVKAATKGGAVALNAGDDLAVALFNSLGTIGKAFFIGGAVCMILTLPLTLRDIAVSAEVITSHTKHNLSGKIRALADDIQNQTEKVKNVDADILLEKYLLSSLSKYIN